MIGLLRTRHRGTIARLNRQLTEIRLAVGLPEGESHHRLIHRLTEYLTATRKLSQQNLHLISVLKVIIDQCERQQEGERQ